MTDAALRALLADVAHGDVPSDEARGPLSPRFAVRPTKTSALRAIDHHRAVRQGMPEVVFGQGKIAAHSCRYC